MDGNLRHQLFFLATVISTVLVAEGLQCYDYVGNSDQSKNNVAGCTACVRGVGDDKAYVARFCARDPLPDEYKVMGCHQGEFPVGRDQKYGTVCICNDKDFCNGTGRLVPNNGLLLLAAVAVAVLLPMISG